MNAEIAKWTRSCLQCQHHHTMTPLTTFNILDARFDHVHIDPLPILQGYTYLMKCDDRFTYWSEAIPISDSTAKTAAQAFVNGWVPRFSTITTDRGQKFESNLWTQLMHLLGTNRVRTTAFTSSHCQWLSGMFPPPLERSAKVLARPGRRHYHSFSLVSVLQDLKCTVAEIVYGRTLRLLGKFFHTHMHTTQTSDPVNHATHLKTMMQRLQPPSVCKYQQRKSHVHTDLSTCSYAFIRNNSVKKPLQPPYDGPFLIPNRMDKYFTLDIAGRKKVIFLSRLKPVYKDTSLPSTNDNSAIKDSTSTDATSTTHPHLQLLPHP